MADINQVYGENYHNEAKTNDAIANAKFLCNNIAYASFPIRHNSQSIWEGNNIKPDIIDKMIKHIEFTNPKMKVTHINKTCSEINMFPYIINGACEYFVMHEIKETSVTIYRFYITPYLVEAF